MACVPIRGGDNAYNAMNNCAHAPHEKLYIYKTNIYIYI